MIIAEYIWLDGSNDLRSKTKVLPKHNISNLPIWNYDGSSTNQATGTDSEVIIKPRATFKCPFRREQNILVLCDTYKPDETPLKSNTRFPANKIFEQKTEHEPWFGIEQEYFLIDPKKKKPLGFSKKKQQGQFYCGVGSSNAYGRVIAEEHLQACLFAEIKISGLNAEVAVAQWEYQIGPCVGIESGDHLWISRYILLRIAEKYAVGVCFHPKPLSKWNGSGCHTNYSTKNMREGTERKTGLEYIEEAIKKLSKKHTEHMEVYGLYNKLRMIGTHETASYDKFTCGYANRTASIRIGNQTIKDKKGYFEDRRPSSNMDPYLVTSKIFETTVLN